MSKAKMEAARELIQEKKYDEAGAILRTVDHPLAVEWLGKIADIKRSTVPSSRPDDIQSPTAEQQFELARRLILDKKYDEARVLLQGISDPHSKEWLSKLEALVPQHTPFAFPDIAPAGPQVIYAQPTTEKSYTNAAVIVLVLYFVLWLPGFVANYMYIKEADRDEKAVGHSLPGTEALRGLFALGALIGVLVVIYIAFAVGSSFFFRY